MEKGSLRSAHALTFALPLISLAKKITFCQSLVKVFPYL